MINSIEELICNHLEDPTDTLLVFEQLPHKDWVQYRDGEVISFVSYFELENFKYNMIISMNMSNVYNLDQWRIISRLLNSRTREIRIESDPSNKVLHKGAKKYGGYFDSTYLIFPYTKGGN